MPERPPAERVLRGRPASSGLAAGPVHRLAAAGGGRVASGDPSLEEQALRDAIAAALVAVEALMEELGGEAADVLGFQAALLSDDELARPAYEAIAQGLPADLAWESAIAAEIAGYIASEEEYFRARAADLEDLRDRVLEALAGPTAAAPVPPGAVVAAHDMPPSRFLAVDWSAGGAVILSAGSPTSHVAMLARSRGVPMVVGLGFDAQVIEGDALVDGEAGQIVLDPGPGALAAHAERREAVERERVAAAALLDKPAATRDGTSVLVHLNIADPGELKALDPAHCDGIGLVRTEFLFHGRGSLPGEEAQFGVYRTIAEWAGGRPVTIRTLDAGGDKPIPGLTLDGESNPFLGLRGVRLSLRHPEVFRVQLRALLRASAYGAVKIMLPMVTTPAEIAAVRAMLDAEEAALAAAGRPHARPPLGIMVEVPAAAVAVDLFDADFFSIGSNDLTQYVTAAGRDSDAVADLADPLHPAVLRLVGTVARHGREAGRDVSLCGDAGGEPSVIPHLLRAGLRSVSVAPAALARTKAAIAAVDLRADAGAAP
ncbi:phosphoenolpyruvate--protein phosphotransferase [Alsobacter sp. R-9]